MLSFYVTALYRLRPPEHPMHLLLLSNSTNFGDAWWVFLEPRDIHFWELFAPTADECRSEYQLSSRLTVYDLEANSTSISASSRPLVRARSSRMESSFSYAPSDTAFLIRDWDSISCSAILAW